MERRNSRYYETPELMDEAFLSLLEEKDLEIITDKDVCSRAGVSRSTFYLHYESFADLMEESTRLMLGRFRGGFDREAESDVFARLESAPVGELNLVVPEYLTPYLEFVGENRRLFSALVENAGTLGMRDVYGRMERHLIAPILDRFCVPERSRRFLMRFYLGGLMAILVEWVKGGCEEPVEEVAEIMRGCCAPRAEA